MADLTRAEVLAFREEVRGCVRCERAAGGDKGLWQGAVPSEVVILGQPTGALRGELDAACKGKAGWIRTVACVGDEPTYDHIQSCKGNVAGQLALLRPQWIVLMGWGALSLFRSDLNVTQMAGRPMYWEGDSHPTWTWGLPLHWTNHVYLYVVGDLGRKKNGRFTLPQLKDQIANFARTRKWWPTLGWPTDCVQCGEEVEQWDANGVGWCEAHSGVQARLLA